MKSGFPIELIKLSWLLTPEHDDLILNRSEPAVDGLLKPLGLNPTYVCCYHYLCAGS